MDDQTIARKLFDLALELRELDVYRTVPDALKKKHTEFRKLIRKALVARRDAALSEALDSCLEEDGVAYDMLLAQVHELTENFVMRTEQGHDVEVNAFVIPMMVRSAGGLEPETCFQDEEAFAQLRDSLQEDGLESERAQVLLVAHAYHPQEIARIGYSQLHAMVREAYEASTRKKMTAAAEIARSVSGWPQTSFSADDVAVELRYLLGFTYKRLDDAFYIVPEKEAAADRYFEAREKRFVRWTQRIVPAIKRCLVAPDTQIDVDFLYQDLFYGGTRAGESEYQVLQIIADLRAALVDNGLDGTAARAVVAPVDAGDHFALRANVYAIADSRLLGGAEKICTYLGSEVTLDHPQARGEIQDLCDALSALEFAEMAVANDFDANALPIGAKPVRRS